MRESQLIKLHKMKYKLAHNDANTPSWIKHKILCFIMIVLNIIKIPPEIAGKADAQIYIGVDNGTQKIR